MLNQIIILAGGKGTRMGNSDLPKVLVHLKDRPIISYLLESIKKLENLLSSIVVVGHRYDLVQAALGPNYIYALQQGQLGTAHAVEAAQKFITGEKWWFCTAICRL